MVVPIIGKKTQCCSTSSSSNRFPPLNGIYNTLDKRDVSVDHRLVKVVFLKWCSHWVYERESIWVYSRYTIVIMYSSSFDYIAIASSSCRGSSTVPWNEYKMWVTCSGNVSVDVNTLYAVQQLPLVVSDVPCARGLLTFMCKYRSA